MISESLEFAKNYKYDTLIKRSGKFPLLFFSFKISPVLFENQTDAEADVVLEESAEDRAVIDLDSAKIDFFVDFYIETAADRHREMGVGESEGDRVGDVRRARAGSTYERVVFEASYADAGERVSEGFKARLRSVVFDLHAAHKIIERAVSLSAIRKDRTGRTEKS